MRAIGLAVLAICFPVWAATAQPLHPFELPQPADPASFYTVIEIPAGGFTKYEIDDETGLVFVDRFLSMPVVYPANYGSLPSSLAGDGDPLDALVLTREPVVPGAVIRVRAVGVLRMLDAGDPDDKIIAVPVSGVDPHYDGIASLDDLPAIQLKQIEAFFRTYKDLPEGRNAVTLSGYGDAEEAQAMVAEAIAAYRAGAQ